jgi:hypothetical protein
VIVCKREASMPNARQKKKTSTRATQGTRRSTKQKDRRKTRAMAARARTQLRSGTLPVVQDAPESGRSADALMTERSGEPVANTFRFGRESTQHTVEQSAGNLGAVLQSGTVVASAMRSILQELVDFIQERMHQNFTRLLALTYCRTPPQLIAVQGDFFRDNVEGVLRSTGRIADVSMQMAHEGARRMSAARWALR